MQPKYYKHVTDHIIKVKCNAATCLIRPQHVGPEPDRIRQVSLYEHASRTWSQHELIIIVTFAQLLTFAYNVSLPCQ